MSKSSQIEGALSRMNQARFERLCTRVLPRLGYPEIDATGRVLGEDKTRVAPYDGWFLLPRQKYGFMQCTAQKPKGLLTKLKEDYAKCLEKELTGIAKSRIGKVVLCVNRGLSASDHASLQQLARRHKCPLEIIGPSILAPELSSGSVDIAKDELGISIGTGQFLSKEEFKRHASQGKYATSYETKFRFREKEVQDVLSALGSHSIVILRGKPGVGKSRLALEVTNRYCSAHTKIRSLCIVDKSLDLYEDLTLTCGQAGDYLLLVDDANLFEKGRLKHVMRLLTDSGSDRQFRMLLTVRGYAEKDVARVVDEFGTAKVIEVQALTDEQIAEFLKDEYGIRNHRFLDKISRQAQGNMRLAAMIGEVAREQKTFESIRSVEDIYNNYFNSRLGDELSTVIQPQTLKVAAIFSMLRTVNRGDEKLMAKILAITQLSEDEFWDGASRLHRIEVIDMMPQGVGRIADQVLAAYLFHRSVFGQEPFIDLAAIITHFIEEDQSRVAEVLNSTFSAFDSEQTLIKVGQAAEVALARFEADGNSTAQQKYHEYFWFVDPARTLAFARELIEAMPTEEGSASPDFSDKARQQAHWRPDALKVLDGFGQTVDVHRTEALKLMLQFLRKRPGSAPEVGQAFLQTFGVDHRSFEYDYHVQRKALEDLVALDPTGTDSLVTGLFFAFAEQGLHLEYRHFGSGRRRNVVTISHHQAGPSTGMLELRNQLWSYAFGLFVNLGHRAQVFDLLRSYKNSFITQPNTVVQQADADQILQFFNDHLKPSNLKHCFFVHDMVNFWKRHKLKGLKTISERFTNPEFELSRLLVLDRSRYADFDRDQWKELWHKDLREFGASLSPFQLRKTIARTSMIARTESRGYWPHDINFALAQVIIGHFEDQPDDAIAAILGHLRQGNRLNIPCGVLLPILLSAQDKEEILSFIDEHPFMNRWFWTIEYFELVTRDDSKKAKDLARSFRERILNCQEEQLHVPITLLHRFEPYDPGITVAVVRYIIDRVPGDNSVPWALHDLFYDKRYPMEDVKRVFHDELESLQRAYFIAATEYSIDRQRDWFDDLLDLDPSFLSKWVGWKYEQSRPAEPSDERGEFEFLWKRDDAEHVLSTVLDAVETLKDGFYGDDEYLASFLKLDSTDTESALLARQDKFLSDEIERHHSNERRMRLLFDMVHDLPPDRRTALIAKLLAHMPSEKLFRDVLFNEGSGITRGSLVPKYSQRVSFLKELRKACTRPEQIQYIRLLDDHMKYASMRLEREQVEDYMDDVL